MQASQIVWKFVERVIQRNRVMDQVLTNPDLLQKSENEETFCGTPIGDLGAYQYAILSSQENTTTIHVYICDIRELYNFINIRPVHPYTGVVLPAYKIYHIRRRFNYIISLPESQPLDYCLQDPETRMRGAVTSMVQRLGYHIQVEDIISMPMCEMHQLACDLAREYPSVFIYQGFEIANFFYYFYLGDAINFTFQFASMMNHILNRPDYLTVAFYIRERYYIIRPPRRLVISPRPPLRRMNWDAEPLIRTQIISSVVVNYSSDSDNDLDNIFQLDIQNPSENEHPSQEISAQSDDNENDDNDDNENAESAQATPRYALRSRNAEGRNVRRRLDDN